MLTMKKIQAVIETIFWIIAVIMMMCIVLPIGAVMSFAGFVLRKFRVNFVSELAVMLMDLVLEFVKFVTRRIKARTQEIEELRTR